MAGQITLGGLTTLNLSTHLDPMFTDLYSIWNVFSPTSGVLIASNPIKVTVSGTVDMAVQNSNVHKEKIVFVDPTRSANGKEAEWNWSSGTFQGRFVNDAYTVAADWVDVVGTSAGITSIKFGGPTSPLVDNTTTLGTGALRWSVVYAGTGTINTSDAREKTAVAPLTVAEIAASKDLAREVGSFQFLAAVADKGAAARRHIGMTVQKAMEIMTAHGLDPMRYAFICRDSWSATETDPAGDRYGFRADELLLFIARGFEARLTALEAA